MKRILTVAGSDSGGGAGIQADLKAITVLGGYGLSVITALTAQNTVGVQAVHPVPIGFIEQQLDSVLSDIGADAAKTGMLATPEIVEVVADGLNRYNIEPLVVDPVMVAKSGDSLLSEAARKTLKTALLPLAAVVTPNLPEAAVLCGRPVKNLDDMREAARRIYDLGPDNVVIKGGHLEGRAVDLLFDGVSFETLEAPRLNQRNTHGTGCTFSAALATILAEGEQITEALQKAKKFITRAIAAGLDIGAGHGPTNPYAHIMVLQERESVLAELKKALGFLIQKQMGGMIPEVRSNLGYALPGALDYQEVAGFPGRISQVGNEVFAYREPAFGASRHIARVILAAMKHKPQLRAAMNIRYNLEILTACKKIGLHTASFDRNQEPKDVKEQEGSSLEWGTSAALEEMEELPDLVYDEGDVGKEPMIRILGKNPMEVVEKINRIKEALG
ncbi:MAG: bifunctional hydroxymethylpyrimidine kinase/phosphomethylpyrimidine kinase [Deltaproteobacteria bacterium]|nr:MAG: bifunctional hydroxymethylpyrimidine kinase/phosphomethylpyrimidine kinase [Deltaproteobacteria bacterium]